MIQVLLTGQACRQSSSHPHLETLERKTIFNMGRVLCFEQLLLINFRLSKWKELTSPSPSISQPGTTWTKSSTCKTFATNWEGQESGHQKIGGFELRNYAQSILFDWHLLRYSYFDNHCNPRSCMGEIRLEGEGAIGFDKYCRSQIKTLLQCIESESTVTNQ